MRKKSIACKTPRPRSTSALGRHSDPVDQVAAVGDSSPNKCADDEKSKQSDRGSPEIFIKERTESDRLEKHHCIKCDKVGKMLVCTEIGCPIAIHEECLTPKPNFDDSGNFYCPYCAYKRAVDKVQRLRKKAMTAKEQLSNFLKFTVVGSTGGKGHENEKKEKAATPQSEGINHHASEIKPNQHIDETHQVRNLDEKSVAKGQKEIGSSEKTKSAAEESNESRESHNECFSENVENKSHESHMRLFLKDEDAEQNDKVPKSSTRVRNIPSHVKKEENVSPLGKRKRFWTPEEEEMLKEGVKIFSDTNKKILPWRKILEFGSHVFHQSRVPIDLQNKWKNMTRKN